MMVAAVPVRVMAGAGAMLRILGLHATRVGAVDG